MLDRAWPFVLSIKRPLPFRGFLAMFSAEPVSSVKAWRLGLQVETLLYVNTGLIVRKQSKLHMAFRGMSTSSFLQPAWDTWHVRVISRCGRHPDSPLLHLLCSHPPRISFMFWDSLWFIATHFPLFSSPVPTADWCLSAKVYTPSPPPWFVCEEIQKLRPTDI